MQQPSARRAHRLRTMPRRALLAGLVLASVLGASPARATGAASAACEARSLAFDQPDSGWKHQPLSKLKRDTDYTVVRDGSRGGVLRAAADRSASMFVAALKQPLRPPLTLAWDWKTDAPIADADSRDPRREDSPLRVLVMFDGDVATLAKDERRRFERAELLTGAMPPYATLMYTLTDRVAAGTVIVSAHTAQVRMIAVGSGGKGGFGQWQSVRRKVADDYRRAFGKPPGAVLAIGVMTDTDNTGARATGFYADVRIGCDKG